MTALVFRGVSFAHVDASPLLTNVTLRLPAGLHGVVGENGSGKTTFLRLAAGELLPDAGSVSLEPRGAVIACCPQTVTFPGEAVARFAEAGDRDARSLRDALELEPRALQRWPTLSPGERRRFQLAAALHARPDVLLVDEPTNHLDDGSAALLVGALARYRGIGLVVAHDRAFLDAHTRSTVRVHQGSVSVHPLPYGEARAVWEQEEAAREAERERRKDQRDGARRRLAEARDRRAQADTQRSAKTRIKGPRDHDARSMGAKVVAGWAEARLGQLTGVRRTELARAEAAIPAFEGARAVGRSVFVDYEPAPRAHVLRYEGDVAAGERVLLRDVRVALARDARVHLVGPNGAGKTTLLRALLRTSTLPRERLFSVEQELAPEDATALLDSVRREPKVSRGRILSLVAALGVDPDRLLASAAPSPGEAKKLAMAAALGRRVWALLLDEPTNHLDLPSIERLQGALRDYPGALLLVSHDRTFAEAVTGVRWAIRSGRLETGAA